MDYLLQLDAEHNVVLITFGRVITKAAVLAVHIDVEHLISAHGPCASIVDLSISVKSELSPQFIRSLAAMSPAVPKETRKILVAPTPETYGLSRMFQLLREGTGDTLRIVYTLEEAHESWASTHRSSKQWSRSGPKPGWRLFDAARSLVG